MANKTVYPYGTGGSLPSSIGLVNDLTTGGVDKALTAEQGKVIGESILDKTVTVLSTSLESKNYSISNVSSHASWGTGTHVEFQVTPGETITITPLDFTTDGGYVILVNEDFIGQSQGSGNLDKYRAPGWSGASWVFEAGKTIVVPDGASYLVCTTSSSGYSTKWRLERTVESELHDTYFEKDKGDELYDSIIGDYVRVDLSEITVSPCYFGSDGNWNQSGSHIVIPVLPGEKYHILPIGSSSDGGYYSLLRPDYVVPSGGETIPYVNGYGRNWLTYPTQSTPIDILVPEGAGYLCLNTLVAFSKTCTWYVEKAQAADSELVLKHDIVNDLYNGGVDKPLSAEQGKFLASKVIDGIPPGLTKYDYIGAPVRINNNCKVATSVVAAITSITCQGGACYGDYLFMFNENNTTCWIYNLATNTLLQTYTIPPEERGFVSNCHNNTANFGTEKYDSGDPFPLIYLSTGYSSGGYSGALVYRIVATTSDSVATYSLTLVQTLKIPGTAWTEFVVGNDGDCYIKQELNGLHYHRMTMPTLSQGDYTFDLEDALQTYNLTPQPSWYNGSQNQGHLYHNGKLYLVSGVPTSQASLFIAIDLATGRREVEIDLYNTLGLHSEPEALFIWNGHFCIAFRSNKDVYALYFE